MTVQSPVGAGQARPSAAGRREREASVLVMLNGLTLGGTELNAVDFAWAVQEHGYRSVLVGERQPEKGRPLLEVAAERGLEVEVIDRPPTTLAKARIMSALARRHGTDIVHTYGWWNARPSFWGPGRFGRVPLVMTAYEMSLQPHIFPRASLIIGTQYQREDLAGRPGPLHFISPPVDLSRDDAAAVPTAELLSQLDLAPDHTRIVIVSRLAEEMKAAGVEAAIRAMEHLPGPDLDLLIVGGGDAEARLRAIGDEVNRRLGRRAVVFAGPMVDPRPAYAAADIMVGMGGSAARSLAFGKPLVAVGEYGWSQAFTPESAAMVFRSSFWSEEMPADAVGDLVAHLRPLVGDEPRRRALGEFGRAFAVENFGLTAMAARLAAVYGEALDRPAPLRTWIAEARADAAPGKLGAYVARRLRRGG